MIVTSATFWKRVIGETPRCADVRSSGFLHLQAGGNMLSDCFTSTILHGCLTDAVDLIKNN
jgi:hypothetical protein